MIKQAPAIMKRHRGNWQHHGCGRMRTYPTGVSNVTSKSTLVGAGATTPPHREEMTERRRGTAAVEFAVCLPVIVMLFMGSIEVAGMLFLKESLTVASYEGARTAAKYDSETQDVISKAEAMLAIKNVVGAQISVSPSDIGNASRGEPITVTVSCPCNANALVPLKFFDNQLITVKSIMVRE